MRVFALLLAVLPALVHANPAAEAPQIIQLLDYMAVDYSEAVREGRVVSQAEYAEMREFSTAIAARLAPLKQPALDAQAARLKSVVENKGEAAELRALTGPMREALIRIYGITTLPAATPDLQLGQRLFAGNCAGCHGDTGLGDGPLAKGLEPPPTDFHDAGRAAQRDLYGLYSTITLGVEGTAMAAYPQLDEHARWSLAAYAASLSRPKDSALDTARGLTQKAAQGYAEGRRADAYRLALAAYLDGFELAESTLSAVDAPLMAEIEGQMMRLRTAMQNGADNMDVQLQARALDEKLALAQQRLGSRKLTGMGAVFAAFLILLREGLEAILVVAALAAYLVKTGQRAGLPYLHAGWAGALLVGVLTWWISENVFTIGGAQREVTEGAAALIAALVMFSVGFWMHSRASAVQWQKFIQVSIRQALSRGTLWGLAGLSFIAVYRECFETVLFYQALWAQTDAGAQNAVVAGALGAAILLAVLAWAILKYSLRLPLREFFAATGLLLFVLAVVFAGKGVVALQEAGWVGVLSVPAPRVELLGIYPNAQSLGAQLMLSLLAAFLIWRGRAPAKA